MDDVHSFHTRAYDKSDDLEDIKLWARILTIAKILPILFVKLLILTFALIFVLLKQILFWFVPTPLKDIRGQLAVVTGGSNGIGREICLELARCGCNIACLDLDLEAAKQLCNEMRQTGVKANAYKVDVSDPKSIEELKREINTDLGVVDILVNNAGLMPRNSLREGDSESIRRIMDVNVLAHFWTTRTFIGDMIERHFGYIVGIASILSFYPASTTISYTTSKFAVKGFMDALNRESQHENWGVKTLTVFPHFTNTRKEMIDHVRRKVAPSTFEQMQIRTPNEVARETVTALRSDAGYVTVPTYFLFFAKLYNFLPWEIQNLYDKLIMPRVTSKKCYSSTTQDTKNQCV